MLTLKELKPNTILKSGEYKLEIQAILGKIILGILIDNKNNISSVTYCIQEINNANFTIVKTNKEIRIDTSVYDSFILVKKNIKSNQVFTAKNIKEILKLGKTQTHRYIKLFEKNNFITCIGGTQRTGLSYVLTN